MHNLWHFLLMWADAQNCTFEGNVAVAGGAVQLFGSNEIHFTNCTFAGYVAGGAGVVGLMGGVQKVLSAS